MYNLEASSIKEFDWPIDYAYYRGIIKKLYKSRKTLAKCADVSLTSDT